MKYLLILIIIFFGFILFNRRQISAPSLPLSTISVSQAPDPDTNNLSEPISDFKQRITKKFFGTYITPQNSPVKSEKFTGFHTAVDVEYSDVTSDVPVFSIDDGQIVYSGKVNGYGGFVAIQYPKYMESMDIYGQVAYY